jgi:ABC-2 type transport system ATP-binding protein
MKMWLSRIVGQGRTVFMTTHVLETVQRLCDRVAIVTTPGRLLWEGRITSLAEGRALVLNGTEFHTLEALYLHLTGRRDAPLEWV